ncbi:MAG: hypothetical protein P1V20_03410 [Verrucomicrobiales bacterium]|nr:hypothetical protein [Verrucomicrobiales bacterium]
MMSKGLVVLGVVVLSIVTYFTIHSVITVEARAALSSDHPELIWLKREYSLNDDQFTKIQELHNVHDVKCREICRELSESRKQLEEVIVGEPLESEVVQGALAAWREQQVVSQNSILKHMEEVSRYMEPGQGARYRSNVYRNLILSGRTPHIDSNGDYNSEFILHLKR